MAPESSPMDAVGTREEAVSIAGAERSVPVRVVQMTNDCMPGAPAHCLNGVQDGGETGVDCGGACPPCLPFTHCNSFHHVRPPMATCTPCSNGTNDCGPDTFDYTQLREAVEKTNWALKSVGVQIPDPYGATYGGNSAPALRYGGVPVPAEKAGRRILRVWDAHLATWYTMYDPVNSTALHSKQQGARGDIPITGPIDFNADGWTDMVVFRPSANPPVVNIVQSTTFSWAATVTFQVTGATSRSVVYGVRDMKNSADNRGELLVVDPDQLSWKLYYSQPSGSFSLTYTRPLGDLGAMIF